MITRVIKPADVEYTTAKNLSEQGAEEALFDDFDTRLNSPKPEQ